MSPVNRPPSVYVDDVFEEVLALPEDQRQAAIDERCSGHPSLAREVRALLGAELRNPDPAPTQLHEGMRLGRYTLDSCLGKGASASVWKAWDTHLRSWTALKLIRQDVTKRRDALQTVLHEARAASAIISDHVVRIKGAGKIPNGPHYVEMQLCAEQHPDQEGGENLVIGRTLSEEPPEDPRKAARLVMEAARGAEAAHRVGVLHRDIKPANVLVMPVSRRALVADFGLSAANIYPEAGPNTSSTATVTIHLHEQGRVLMGTPSFMPPEQAWGEPASRSNDVYSLGATLYALLAHRAPYQELGERPRPALEVVKMVRDGPPLPLKVAAPRAPAQLVRIVEKAMARDPASRYTTAGALAADLKHFLAHHTTSVDGRRPVLSLDLFARRHRAVLATAVVLLGMIAVALFAVGALEMRRLELMDDVASAQIRRDKAEKEAAMAERVRGIAEATRDQAIVERDDALEEKHAAIQARDAAQLGQTAAERRAQAEIEARLAAEEERLQAENLRAESELETTRQKRLRASMEEELAGARAALQNQLAQAELLKVQLRTQMDENKDLEADLRDARASALDLRTRIQLLETELELARTEVETGELASDPSDEAAPWMNPADTEVVGPQPP